MVRLLRRPGEDPPEAVDEDHDPAVADREPVAPEPERVREPEVGGKERVRPLARQKRGGSGDPDHERVERLVESRRRSSIARSRASACATDGGPASTAAVVLVPRSVRRTRRRTESGAAENASLRRRARDPLGRLRLVRDSRAAAPRRRVVEDERDAEERDAGSERTFDERREAPPFGPSGLEQRFGGRATLRLRVCGGEQRRWAAVQDGLGSGDRDDEIRLHAAHVRPGRAARRPEVPRGRGRRRRAPSPGRGSGGGAPESRVLRSPHGSRGAPVRRRRAASGWRSGCRAPRARRSPPRLPARAGFPARSQSAVPAAPPRSSPGSRRRRALRAAVRRAGNAAPRASPPPRPSLVRAAAAAARERPQEPMRATRRLPERRGTRGIAGFKQRSSRLSTDCPAPTERRKCANGGREVPA